MIKSLKYRSVALVLAGIFVVFNVGIPVVLASCPMIQKSVKPSCCPQQSDFKYPVVKKYSDYSCCKTIIAADRNKTEFLQTQTNGLTTLQQSIIPLIHSIDLDEPLSFAKFINLNLHSPPLIEDIPIFTSSLLI